jgi:hypothetical protein
MVVNQIQSGGKIMNKIFVLLFIFCLLSCERVQENEVNWTMTNCNDYEEVKKILAKKPELKKEKDTFSYYLLTKGKCDLSQSSFKDAELSLAASAVLGEDLAAYTLAHYKLLVKSDLSQLPIILKLTSSDVEAAKTISGFLGKFLLVDTRAKEIVDFSVEDIQSIGLKLIDKSKSAVTGFYSYYFLAIYKDNKITHSQRLSLIEEGNKLQEKVFGRLQVECSDIYRQFAYFDIDKSKLLEKCPNEQ